MPARSSRTDPQPAPPALHALPPPPVLGYRPALDGLRALAVVLVVVVHTTYLLVPEWGGRWLPGGFFGVDVFFVLSGFLITTLLLEEHDRTGTVSLRSFFARRALRLLPAVAGLLLVHAMVAAVAGADLGVEARTVAVVALYAMNWFQAAGADVAAGLGHLWSLSVEEQFYLLWPMLLLFAMRRRRPTRTIVLIAFAGIAWATGVRAWLWQQGAGWEEIYVRTDARVDELLMGVVLAVAFRKGWRSSRLWRFAGAGSLAVLLLLAATVHRESEWLFVGGGFTVVGLASVLLIASVLDAPSPLARAFAWSPAVSLGKASYSLYLWHVPIFVVIADRLGGRPAGQRLVLGLAGCAVATLASYHLIELPVLRYRRRKAAGAAPPAALLVPSGSGASSSGRQPSTGAENGLS